MTVEPLTGIEPVSPAWKAGVLPLNYSGGLPGVDHHTRRCPSFRAVWWKRREKKSRGAERSPRGAGGRTRTPDLLITNQLLYRLSYTSGYALHGGGITTQGLHVFPCCHEVNMKALVRLVEISGIEPLASCLQGRRSPI